MGGSDQATSGWEDVSVICAHVCSYMCICVHMCAMGLCHVHCLCVYVRACTCVQCMQMCVLCVCLCVFACMCVRAHVHTVCVLCVSVCLCVTCVLHVCARKCGRCHRWVSWLLRAPLPSDFLPPLSIPLPQPSPLCFLPTLRAQWQGIQTALQEAVVSQS